MQGKKIYQEKLFVNFQLSDHVPGNNLYRLLKETVDFSFLYASTSKYYGQEGQKSLDPVVFMKLMLAGYLENLNSDRRIVNVAAMRMDILYFIGYDLGEELPWHSTLSRTRQLYGAEVFTELFKRVLKQCIDKGMVSGRRQAVDSVYIKANASLDSMNVEREILSDAEAFGQELAEHQEAPDEVVKLERPREHNERKLKKNQTNKTHYSASDPDARMSVKPGKAAAMNYLGQIGVDMASHVITHTEVFPADKRDQQCLPDLLPNLVQTLKTSGLAIEELVADAGYSSIPALKAIEAAGLTGYIPNNHTFIYQREGFTYCAEENLFICPKGESLTYRGTHPIATGYIRRYKVSKLICRECALNEQCPVVTVNGGIIHQLVDKYYYDQMHERMQTRKAKILMKRRHSTVEPVIGTLVDYLGMKKVRCKGLAGVSKCLALAAAAYNLKKMLKYRSRLVVKNIKALAITLKSDLTGYTRYIDLSY